MTLPVRPLPDQTQRNQSRRAARRSRLVRPKQNAISYLDPYSSDDYDEEHHFTAFGEEAGVGYRADTYDRNPVHATTMDGAALVKEEESNDTDSASSADADDEAENVLIHYASQATFQRPMLIQCSSSSTTTTATVTARATNLTISDPSQPQPEPDLWLELGREHSPPPSFGTHEGENVKERWSVGEGDDFYREAEERLEKRLAEDRAREKEEGQRQGGFVRLVEEEGDDDAADDGFGEGEEAGEGVHWSEVVYNDDDSIVEEHLIPIHLDEDDNVSVVAPEEAHQQGGTEIANIAQDEETGGNPVAIDLTATDLSQEEHVTDRNNSSRPNSAMSELDLLVRDSLVIAQGSEILSPTGMLSPTDRPVTKREGVTADWPGMKGKGGKGRKGKKRKVSFTLVEGGGKRTGSLGPSTPYPFGMVGEGEGGGDEGKENEGGNGD